MATKIVASVERPLFPGDSTLLDLLLNYCIVKAFRSLESILADDDIIEKKYPSTTELF